MRLVFAGTSDFAAVALEGLQRAGHAIPLVLTQPDRPAGRGLAPQPPPVKRHAETLGLAVRQPSTLKDPEFMATLRALSPEAIVVAAYGLMVPREMLDIPPRGCLNIHASLLPRWRGAAPIQRALLAGDVETGISIMQMNAGLDTGPVILAERTPITPDDTALSLHERLAEMGSRLIVQALARPGPPQPQDEARATYAPKIDKAEAAIDWREPALAVDRKVRAFNPAPGATTVYAGAPLKVWRARPGGAAGGLAPGSVCRAGRDGIEIACGDDRTLCVLELQRAGGRRLSAAAFLAGTALGAGVRLGGG